MALAESVYSTTSATASHGYSPYRALYLLDPRPIQVNDNAVSSPAAEEWLERIVKRMTMVHAQIRSTLKEINDKHSKLHLDKSRQFNVGDREFVDRRNLTIKAGNSRSLAQKLIGPYKIIKVISRHAYKLEYPKRHPHASCRT